jgi:hypothetical protein
VRRTPPDDSGLKLRSQHAVKFKLFAVDFRKHLHALEVFRTACGQVAGNTVQLSTPESESALPENKRPKAPARADFHISLSHTNPAAYPQRKTLLKGLRKAFDGWRPLILKLDTLQVGSLTTIQGLKRVLSASEAVAAEGRVHCRCSSTRPGQEHSLQPCCASPMHAGRKS